MHSDIEKCLDISLDTLKSTKNPHEFIFHTALVEHVTSDLQSNIASQYFTQQKPPLNLFLRAIEKFITALNPIAQVKNTCEILINTAHFVADVTLGHFYLTSAQYQQRIDSFWSTIDALSPSKLALLTNEQWVDLAAQCAADTVFAFGIFKAIRYLKQIDIINKAKRQSALIAQQFKDAADKLLAKNPIFITQEGIIIKPTHHEMMQISLLAQEAIYDSRTLLESAQKGYLASMEQELIELRHLFDNKIKGFGTFANKYLKIAYEHILGIEFRFTRRGIPEIEGFHHDYMNYIKNSGLFEFINKVITKDGFYKADVLFQGATLKRNATFFPANWSRQQVINTISQAYKKFTEGGGTAILNPNNIFQIEVAISTDVKIRMHITKKGLITSAYPLLK